MVPGRFVYRVDEQIVPGGCSNESVGKVDCLFTVVNPYWTFLLGFMYTAPTEASMLGGITVNVSGPCIRPGDNVVVVFDEFVTNCRTIHMGRAMCILPKFHKIGMISTKFSRDGGLSYPFVGQFYLSNVAGRRHC